MDHNINYRTFPRFYVKLNKNLKFLLGLIKKYIFLKWTLHRPGGIDRFKKINMTKIFYIIVIFIALLSCQKEKDVTGEDFTVTSSVAIWNASSMERNYTADSTEVKFYESYSDSIPFSIQYTGPDGKCSVILKGDKDYYFRAKSASYKNSTGQVYHYENAGAFHSTHEQRPGKFTAGDFEILFLYLNTATHVQKIKGSTNNIYRDPTNYSNSL